MVITWSKPLKRIDRTRTVTSRWTPRRNPAHSRATYDAPITTVLPGLCCSENKSSLQTKTNNSYTKINTLKNYIAMKKNTEFNFKAG